MVHHSARARAAFTLVELLVVIAIIGVLVALLLPAVQAAREAANRMSCSNNLKQIGIGLHNYHDTNKAIPEAGYRRTAAGGVPNISWRVPLLPFIEEQPTFDRFRLDLPYNNTTADAQGNSNSTLRTVLIDSYFCPSAGASLRKSSSSLDDATVNGQTVRGYTSHYFGLLGPSGNDPKGNAYGWDPDPAGHGGFGTTGALARSKNGDLDFASVFDGLSNTMFVGESSFSKTLAGSINDSYRSWTRGCGDSACAAAKNVNSAFKVDEYNGSNNFNMISMGSEHPGGAMFGMGDGSVKFVSATIDFNTYRAAATRNGGESLQLP